MDNTIDMQSVPRTREKSAQACAKQHKGTRARVPAGVGDARAPRAAYGAMSGALGSNAKLRATFYDPMESRVQRFALQSMARAILPESRTAKCLRIRAFD